MSFVGNFLTSTDGNLHGPALWWQRFFLQWVILSRVWILLQVIEIVQRGDSSGASLPAYVLLTISSTFWLIQGTAIKNDRTLILTGSLGLILSVAVVAAILIYQ